MWWNVVYATIADWTVVGNGYVVDVTIRQTVADTYPSGWDYGLRLGEVGGDTILRYDSAHERTNGHERHTRDGVEFHPVPGNESALRTVQNRS